MLIKKFEDNLSISIDQTSNVQVINAIKNGISECDFPFIIEAVSSSFAVYAQDKHNVIVGGVTGFYGNQYAKINLTWVNINSRKQNIGSRLFRILEDFLIKENCMYIQAEVFEHETKKFYEKHDFSEVGKVEDWVENYTCYFMKKKLG